MSIINQGTPFSHTSSSISQINHCTYTCNFTWTFIWWLWWNCWRYWNFAKWLKNPYTAGMIQLCSVILRAPLDSIRQCMEIRKSSIFLPWSVVIRILNEFSWKQQISPNFYRKASYIHHSFYNGHFNLVCHIFFWQSRRGWEWVGVGWDGSGVV